MGEGEKIYCFETWDMTKDDISRCNYILFGLWICIISRMNKTDCRKNKLWNEYCNSTFFRIEKQCKKRCFHHNRIIGKKWSAIFTSIDAFLKEAVNINKHNIKNSLFHEWKEKGYSSIIFVWLGYSTICLKPWSFWLQFTFVYWHVLFGITMG